MVVRSLVLSHFLYCASILASIQEKLIHKLQTALNAALRLLFRLKRFEGVQSALAQLELLPMKLHLQHRVLQLLHTTLRTDQPLFLRELVTYYVPSRSLRSESLKLLNIPATRRRNTDRTYSVLAPRLWNSLPNELRVIDSGEDFRLKSAAWLGTA